MTIDTDNLISPPESRAADKLGDALADIEMQVSGLLDVTGLSESMIVDQVAADVAPGDEQTANVEIRWSKLKIPGYGPSRRIVARQLRAFADGLERLELEL